MRKMMMLAAMLFVAAIPVYAQDNYPAAEIFGGYSYLSVDTGANTNGDISDFFDNRESFHGVGFSVAGNFSRSFGLVGDFSYNRKSIDLIGDNVKLNQFFFLFGPRVYARGNRVTGFGHALIGGVRTKTTSNVFGDFGSDTNFAMGFGGGVDVNVTDSIGVRLVQLDYIPVRAEGEWFHNLRAQVGITFRLQ